MYAIMYRKEYIMIYSPTRLRKDIFKVLSEGREIEVLYGQTLWKLSPVLPNTLNEQDEVIRTNIEHPVSNLTIRDILTQINKKKDSLGEADEVNQDPDYWAYRKEQEAEIQALWTKYHEMKGE